MHYLLLIYEDEKALRARREDPQPGFPGIRRSSHPRVSGPSRFVRSGTTSDVESESSTRVNLCLRATAGRPQDGAARILSSLIRTCGGDFDLAEEALHDAVVAAEHAYQRAIELASNDPERRFLEARLREVQGIAPPRAT